MSNDMGSQIIRAFASDRNLPPQERNYFRSGRGAFIIAFAVYLAVRAKVLTGMSFEEQVSAYLRMPTRPPWLLIGWVVVMAWGIVSLCVGISRSRGRRDALEAFWSIFTIGLCVALLEWAYLPIAWGAYISITTINSLNVLGQGLYIAGLAEGVTGLILALRGPGGGNAANLVNQQIQRTSISWRVGRQRKF